MSLTLKSLYNLPVSCLLKIVSILIPDMKFLSVNYIKNIFIADFFLKKGRAPLKSKRLYILRIQGEIMFDPNFALRLSKQSIVQMVAK